MRAPLRLMGKNLLSLIYPPGCAVCSAGVQEAHALCASCWSRLGVIERPYCERLGTPFAVDHGAGLLSPAAMADPPVYNRARVVSRYDEVAMALVRRLKYADKPELSLSMARMMARAGTELLREADVIVPVPLHYRRLWRRRFNQAAMLGQALSKLAGIAHDPLILARRKATRPQVGLTRAQRRENLQGAFTVPPEARARIEGKRVVLIDDVITTGSTLNAASRALLRGGAASVDCLAFARVILEDA